MLQDIFFQMWKREYKSFKRMLFLMVVAVILSFMKIISLL